MILCPPLMRNWRFAFGCAGEPLFGVFSFFLRNELLLIIFVSVMAMKRFYLKFIWHILLRQELLTVQ